MHEFLQFVQEKSSSVVKGLNTIKLFVLIVLIVFVLLLIH
ncbi:hypothetical protein E0E46_03440 [Gardnerella vaginalis ATCC 14018 = JCM 11026]|uniref:Uncharacterized protein n=1 Tax=Gardnerella vaginalis (strain ATCC 14019 / 317) TaxID=525284 RepID=E3DAI9_GARV3|nr:hypothetical protein HMPREF0421_21001 [Gardnerella vaginalis ATCC 14019]PKZ45178.1 hypothetical protein CYJ68_06925 [Gardnerella vaginalis]TCH81104.1 hypothetical protein E0E48_02620 [Gardnerella vaginalis]TCH82347.1 hypothetical protein E0E46_03440 [Gardnerella vaginalis ATCC 14018 = JCM 11026]